MQVSNFLPFGTLAFVWPTWLIAAVTVIFLAVCVIMVLTVLIQKPQGGGLASAFGGGASAGQTAFGTKTGDALTVFTIAVFVLYLICAVVLNYAARPQVLIAPPTAEGTPPAGAPATAPAGGTQPQPATPTDGTQPAPADSKPAEGTPPSAPAAPAAPQGNPGTAPATNPAPTTTPTPAPGNPQPAPANTEPKTNPGR